MTRFLAEQLSTAHWFDQRRTREVLDWRPRSVSTRASSTWRPGSPASDPSLTGVSSPPQVPKISRSWLTSRKPCCSATALAQVSTAGPETSTVRPQLRQTRWWW